MLDIKKAYRQMCKKCHPDVADTAEAGGEDMAGMHELTDAYQTLLDYCNNYRGPLSGKSEEIHDA